MDILSFAHFSLLAAVRIIAPLSAALPVFNILSFSTEDQDDGRNGVASEVSRPSLSLRTRHKITRVAFER